MKKHRDQLYTGHTVLAVGFILILLLMLLLTRNAMLRVEEFNLHIQLVVMEYSHKTTLLKKMHRAARQRTFIMHHMLLLDDPFAQDEEAMKIERLGLEITTFKEELLALHLSDLERQLLEQQGAIARYAVPLQREAIQDILAGEVSHARQLIIEEIIPTQHQVLSILEQLEEIQSQAMERTARDAQQQQQEASKSFLLVGGASLLLGLLIFALSLYLARRLTYQAHHDPLTGISNRRGFEQQLMCFFKGTRSHEEGYLCMMDLDHFKAVNDQGGHAAGDALLQELTTLIRQVIRRDDLFARMGGDEFALLLKECPLDNARHITQEIRHTVANHHFEWDGLQFQVGISIGLVSLKSGNRDAAELMTMADDACYSAKASGRNQIHLYSESGNGIEAISVDHSPSL
ncbi:MAG: diguanylate cyclase [Chromatiales bacterium]|nr:diguanylate cyclase [Chromatiales bacterium]